MSPQLPNDDLSSLLSRSHLGSSIYGNKGGFESRNSEDIHNDALAAAQAEHERVRQGAIRAYELNELRISQFRLHQQALQEEERVRIEMQKALDAIKIREAENKAKQIPKVPPRVKTPPPPPSPPCKPPQATTSNSQPPAHAPTPPAVPKPQQSQTVPQAPSSQPPTGPPLPAQPPATLPVQPVQPVPPTPPTPPKDQASQILPNVDRYVAIHKSLKNLRVFIAAEGKKDSIFKKKTGEMRRIIKQSIGQLIEGKGKNTQPRETIWRTLREALNTIPSPPVDPSIVMVTKPDSLRPNDESLPALYIYLLNIFSKAVVSQFVNEAGVSPKTADPVGVIATSTFAQLDFMWRGKPLIDILIAKMRVACPVLFGIRGSEKTEEGRTRLGWKRDESGEWSSEQIHTNRMAGLGTGYAALSLRNYSKARVQNPWKPVHYWQAIASITSTPSDEASPTQYTVLKALIEHHEEKFISFYGHAARAALQVALVDFPGRALHPDVTVSSLRVLADKLKRDVGLKLER